jgi:hypothetical protein
MKTKIVTVCFLLLILSASNYAQNHPLLNSDNIPLMGLHHSAWHDANLKIPLYPKLQEMGLEGVIFGDVSQAMFDGFYGINSDIKLIPWQVHFPVNYIDHYTNAVYTIWQAHDTSQSDLKAALSFDSSIGERVNGGNIIRTKPNAQPGKFISGPGYNQRIRYSYDVSWQLPDIIFYRSSFNIKVEPNELYPDPPQSTQGLTDTICKIKIVVKEIEYDTINIPHRWHFKNIIVWDSLIVTINQLQFNEWKKFDIEYDFTGLPINFKSGKDFTAVFYGDNVMYSDTLYADYVEFYIEWNGVDYASLYFDTLLVSDDRGRQLFAASEQYRNKIRNQANNTADGYFFNENIVSFAGTVAGFYGQDEPGTIDNLEPIRIIRELLDSATNGKRPLFISASGEGN